MEKAAKDGRSRQRLRTRKDLLRAASRLLKAGRKPSMDEVAEEALVSRATAYRYFPDIESLLVEAPVEDAVPDPQQLFGAEASLDPVERVDKAEAALHAMTYRNEAQIRLMLANSLSQSVTGRENHKTPRRQNRRTALIEEALAPVRDQLRPAHYKRLCAALALFFGTESMVVFRDVVPLSEHEARKVKRWAIRILVRATLEKSKKKA